MARIEEGKVVEYIDITPTWRGILPVLVEVAVKGETVAARKAAMDELYRIADVVDRMVADEIAIC